MKKLLSNFYKTSILSSLALLVLGILLVFKSETTVMMISYEIGGILIAIGFIAEINYFKNHDKQLTIEDIEIFHGLACIILGILAVENPKTIASIIPLVIGVIMIANGAIKLQYSMELRKENCKLWVYTLVLSIVMAVCGVILIFNPFKGALLITRVVGIFILIYSILDIVSTVFIKKALVKLQEAITGNVSDAVVVEETETKKLDKKEEDNKDKEKGEDEE